MSLYDTKTVKDLKALLRQRGLDTKGQKYVLIERLEEFDSCVDEEAAQEVTGTNHSSVVIDEDVSVNVNDVSKLLRNRQRFECYSSIFRLKS
jgi:hypothetical protein